METLRPSQRQYSVWHIYSASSPCHGSATGKTCASSDHRRTPDIGTSTTLFSDTIDWDLIENPLAGPSPSGALDQSRNRLVCALASPAGYLQPAESPLPGLQRARPRH